MLLRSEIPQLESAVCDADTEAAPCTYLDMGEHGATLNMPAATGL